MEEYAFLSLAASAQNLARHQEIKQKERYEAAVFPEYDNDEPPEEGFALVKAYLTDHEESLSEELHAAVPIASLIRPGKHRIKPSDVSNNTHMDITSLSLKYTYYICLYSFIRTHD